MVRTTDALADVVRRAREAGAVGVDTEFVWDRTYYPTLGLLQIGFPDGHCELIDALEIKDWSPLAVLMSDANTIKILHDAQQDLNILYRVCSRCPKNIFDTQRSCGFVGMSSTISLSELLKSTLRVHLAKTETRSDWLARPLTDEQLKYAQDDVRYSVDLMVKIISKAEALERRSWIQDEMKIYEDESKYCEHDPDEQMPRVRGCGSLTNQQRDILRALGAWRERCARRRNLPRGFVLSDDALVSLTKQPPSSPEDIRKMKGLSERAIERNRSEIWQAIERGRNGEMPDLVINKNTGQSPDEGFESRVDLSLAYIKGTCLAQKIDPALIGNRSEVTAFVLEAASIDPEYHRMLRGWRGSFCGKSLLNLLGGEGSISVNPENNLPILT